MFGLFFPQVQLDTFFHWTLAQYNLYVIDSLSWHHVVILVKYHSVKVEFVYHIFRTCLEDPARAGPSPSLDALPRLTPGLLPWSPDDCIWEADNLVPSLANSWPVVGIPLWRRVLVLRSRSRDIGRGEVAET